MTPGRSIVPRAVVAFVRAVDALNKAVGRFAMGLFFVLAAIMLYAVASRAFLGQPVNWALEMSQFVLSAYYLLGGAYAMQMGSHVRMDLIYGARTPRTRAMIDAFTILFVIFYLGVVIAGGLSSTEYALTYGQKNYTSWAPPMWPIKMVMTLGVFLVLLQALSNLCKDIALLRGTPIGQPSIDRNPAA